MSLAPLAASGQPHIRAQHQGSAARPRPCFLLALLPASTAPSCCHGWLLAPSEQCSNPKRKCKWPWEGSGPGVLSSMAVSFLLYRTQSRIQPKGRTTSLNLLAVALALGFTTGSWPPTRLGATDYPAPGAAAQPLFCLLHCSSVHVVFAFFQSSGTSPC